MVSRGFQAGATFFLFKPINRERLLNLSRTTHGAVERERRHYQRVVVSRNVHILFDGDVLEGRTIDVSLNGLLVRAARTLAVGSAVSIRLFLRPERNRSRRDGTVVRVAGPHMGIHLARIAQDASKRLQDFLLPLILPVPDAQVDLDD